LASKYSNIVNGLMKKWRNYLKLDPIWVIEFKFIDSEEMNGSFAMVNADNSEYYAASVYLSDLLTKLPETEFKNAVNEVLCHELIHLVMIDFMRTAQLAADEDQVLQDELRYKFEQYTTRMQRAFMDLDKKVG
jgi:uncharacterized protein YdeI (YjbR/CyaY-like superfamily)